MCYWCAIAIGMELFLKCQSLCPQSKVPNAVHLLRPRSSQHPVHLKIRVSRIQYARRDWRDETLASACCAGPQGREEGNPRRASGKNKNKCSFLDVLQRNESLGLNFRSADSRLRCPNDHAPFLLPPGARVIQLPLPVSPIPRRRRKDSYRYWHWVRLHWPRCSLNFFQ